MKRTVEITGLNVQWPWSQLLLNGKKKIETRNYPLPDRLLNTEIALIETPGKLGKKNGVSKARIVGILVFKSSYEYRNREHWISEKKKHLVDLNDPTYAFDNKKKKYAWVVAKCERCDVGPPPKVRGIIFARNCRVTLLDAATS